MKVAKAIRITSPPEKIWPFLIDPEKIPMWFDSFQKCEYEGERRAGVGTAYYE